MMSYVLSNRVHESLVLPLVWVFDEGVGVMKDKEPNLEDIEDSHTLGGVVIRT